MRTRYFRQSRKSRIGAWLFLTAALLASSLGTGVVEGKESKDKKSKSQDEGKVELGLVVKAVEDAVKEAETKAVEGFPDLQSVSVQAQTTVEKDAGGQIKLFVFTIGARITVDNVSSVMIELKPPKKEPTKLSPSSVNPETIKNAVARQIQAAKLAYISAQQNVKSLKTDKVEIQVSFSVSKQGSGGVDTATLLPVGISADGKYTRTNANVITLDYGTAAP